MTDLVTGEPAPTLAGAIADLLRGEADEGYTRDRLHYGSDLDPEKCERAIWLKLRGASSAPQTLGQELTWWRGRAVEQLAVEALRKAGRIDARSQLQVRVKPVRPSAWAWEEGHADVLTTDGTLYEIKAPGGSAVDRAGNDPLQLVRSSYRWQLSAYWHELARRGRARRAVFAIVDVAQRGAVHEIPLEDAGLIPLERVISQETKRAALVPVEGREDVAMPGIAPRELGARVWKGRANTAAGSPGGRRLEVTGRLNWQCGFCAFRGPSCTPGEDEIAVPEERIPADTLRAIRAAADRAFLGGSSTPTTVHLNPDGTVKDNAAELEAAVGDGLPKIERAPGEVPVLELRNGEWQKTTATGEGAGTWPRRCG